MNIPCINLLYNILMQVFISSVCVCVCIDGPLLYARVLYPPNFSTSQSYPVLFYVYGGPYSQMVVWKGAERDNSSRVSFCVSDWKLHCKQQFIYELFGLKSQHDCCQCGWAWYWVSWKWVSVFPNYARMTDISTVYAFYIQLQILSISSTWHTGDYRSTSNWEVSLVPIQSKLV